MKRKRGEIAPDVTPIELPSGVHLGVEVKSRKALPKLITGALDQARGYFRHLPGTIPIAVLFELGQRGGVACLPLDALAELVGLDVARLPAPRPLPRPRKTNQLELFPVQKVS